MSKPAVHLQTQKKKKHKVPVSLPTAAVSSKKRAPSPDVEHPRSRRVKGDAASSAPGPAADLASNDSNQDIFSCIDRRQQHCNCHREVLVGPGADFAAAFSDSRRHGASLLAHFTGMSTPEFLESIFEKKSLLTLRTCRDHYCKPPQTEPPMVGWRDDRSILSVAALKKLMRDNALLFGRDVDIAVYEDGKRQNLTPEVGVAYPNVVWRYFTDGCSVRLSNPAVVNDNLWDICAYLQDVFNAAVGANVYMTPAGAQGFGPHFDDVDVFVLQLAGRKRWRLYCPASNSVLSRLPSLDFAQSDLPKPFVDVVLEVGDFLYLPRGTVHQAESLPDDSSLHVTISVNHLQTMSDLIEQGLPRALETARANNVELRAAIPAFYRDLFGTRFHSQVRTLPPDERSDCRTFLRRTLNLVASVAAAFDVAEAADAIARRFMLHAFPPKLQPMEQQYSILGEKSVDLTGTVELAVRLIRRSAVHVVGDSNAPNMYTCHYSTENSRFYQGGEGNSFSLEAVEASALQSIVDAYPRFLRISALTEFMPVEDAVVFVEALFERKILLIMPCEDCKQGFLEPPTSEG